MFFPIFCDAIVADAAVDDDDVAGYVVVADGANVDVVDVVDVCVVVYVFRCW